MIAAAYIDSSSAVEPLAFAQPAFNRTFDVSHRSIVSSTSASRKFSSALWFLVEGTHGNHAIPDFFDKSSLVEPILHVGVLPRRFLVCCDSRS